MNKDRETVDQYSALSNIELSNAEQQEIWNKVEQRIARANPMKNRKRFSHVWTTSAAATIAVFIVIGGFYAVSNNSSTAHRVGKTIASNQPFSSVNNTNQEHPEGFNYSQYLSFIPLLPSDTLGLKVTRSIVSRQLSTKQSGSVTSYSASYGNALTITEGRPSQLHVLSSLGPKSKITLSNGIHATVQEYDGGDSIDFTQNGLRYDISTINGGISLEQLKRICTSVKTQVKTPPTAINISNYGPKATKELNFTVVQAGQFYVPTGYSLNSQESTITIKGLLKSESFQITYTKGSSFLTILQSTDSQPSNSDANYKTVTIQGTPVLVQHVNLAFPVAVFMVRQTKIHVVVSSNISSNDLTRVIKSFLNSAAQNNNA